MHIPIIHICFLQFTCFLQNSLDYKAQSYKNKYNGVGWNTEPGFHFLVNRYYINCKFYDCVCVESICILFVLVYNSFTFLKIRVITLGYKKPLERDDLLGLSESDSPYVVCPDFEKQWRKEILKSAKDQKVILIYNLPAASHVLFLKALVIQNHLLSLKNSYACL